ncbi:MAG: 50S ribosomal protein L24 [Saprospiraceae bacterium]|nr:50S ribosomal protein L24 [Saprospiraceae bacterium]
MSNKSKRFQPKLHIKKGDKVVVISGDDKGTQGEVKEVLLSKNRVIIEGVNMVKKHTKPTNDNPGGIIEMEAPIHASNVMLVDPKSGDATRVGRKVVDGKSVRYSKKSGETIK